MQHITFVGGLHIEDETGRRLVFQILKSPKGRIVTEEEQRKFPVRSCTTVMWAIEITFQNRTRARRRRFDRCRRERPLV